MSELNPDGSQQGAPDGKAAGGNAAPAWTAQLPDAHKGNEVLTKFQTIGDLAGDYLERAQEAEVLKSQMANTIPKLADDATPEQREAFYKALGRPENPDGYELPTVQLPPGMTTNPMLDEWYRKTAYDLGLTPAQAKTLYEGYNTFVMDKLREQEAARAEALNKDFEAVKTEWGDQFEAHSEIVRRAQEAFGVDNGFKEWLTSVNGENNPVLLRFFLKVGKAMLDDASPPAGGGAPKTKVGMNYETMDQFRGG